MKRERPGRLLSLRGLVRKEFLQIRADRRMIPVLLVAPLVQLMVFSYAANLDVATARVVILDHDRTPESRSLADRIGASDSFERLGEVRSPEEARQAIADGRAEVAVTIPAGYGAALQGRRPESVQVMVDGTDATLAQVGLTAATGLVATSARDAAAARLAAEGLDAPVVARAIDLRPRVLFNPDLRSRFFLIPGVLGTVLMVVTMVASSMAVVREKELGTLEQLLVTPVSATTILAGKLVPFAVFGLFDSLVILAVAHWWFHVPMEGSPLLLLANVIPFLLCTLGLGLLVSTLSRTQQQAMMTAMFFVMIPMIYLSGFVFAVESMPRVIQPFTELIPLRHFLLVVRGVMLKGAGFVDLLAPIAKLWGLGIAIFAAAVLRFRKRIG